MKISGFLEITLENHEVLETGIYLFIFFFQNIYAISCSEYLVSTIHILLSNYIYLYNVPLYVISLTEL